MEQPFDWRNRDLPPEPQDVERLVSEQEIRRLHDQARDMVPFYNGRNEPLMAVHWSGKQMAYALLLRDVFDAADADDLIAAVIIP